MSLLTQASLVLTPTAYKAGTLYSIIPSSGNGDMTLTRALSTATRTNSSGVIETVNANVPRLDYTNGVASILLEPQRTNLCTYSEDFSNVGYTKNGTATITTNTTITPDNNTTADTLSGASGVIGWATGNTLNKQVSSTLSSTTYYFSLYVKSLGATTISVGLRNQSTGALQTTVTAIDSNWKSIKISFTTGSTQTAIGIILGNTDGNVAIWGMQLEQGAYATSYIATVASSVTRNADVISRSNIYTSGFITSSGGTWFIELNNNFSVLRDAGTSFGIGDTNLLTTNSFQIKSTGTSRLYIIKTVSGIATALYLTTTDTVKIAIKWNGLTADIYVNGTKIISATTFTTTVMEYLSYYVADVSRYIKSTMLFPIPLTDAECASLTTL